MGDWHFRDLKSALERRGWTIVDLLPGDDHFVAGSWVIERSTSRPKRILDFHSSYEADYLTPRSLSQAYACYVRSPSSISLSFSKQHKSFDRNKWHRDLAGFVDEIDSLDAADNEV